MQQKDFIISLHHRAKKILQYGDEGALMMSLADKRHQIKELIDSVSQEELDQYCESYDGFYRYIKLLERLAQGCADGIFDDLKEH